MADSVRIDKYLWAIRVFKTRSEATDACSGGKVKVSDTNAKPSKTVGPGDHITVRKGMVTYSFKVLKPLEHRVGASLLTDPAELEKLHAPVETFFVRRDRGTGRPTKKDRREMEALWDSLQ